jgi:hypothetical protein
MDKKWLISRRALLGGLGAFGASSILRPGIAQAAPPPPRLLLVHVPEGMWSGAQRPVVGASTFGPIFGAVDPYREWLIALNNLNIASRDKGPGGDGHHRAVPHMFTGTEMADTNNAGGPSVDQKIAQAIGTSSKFQSLQLSARIIYGDTNSKPIWSAAKRVVPAQGSPFEAYKRIFASVQPGATPSKPVFDLKKSALDHSLVDLNSLRARLAVADRERLDSYHDSLRNIEKRLVDVSGPAPGVCTPPSLGGTIDVKQESNYPKVGQLQLDLIVAAFQCGLTRVASMQFGNSNDQCSYSFIGVNTLGHDMAHNNSNCDPNHAKKLKTYQWYAKEQFAYLMKKLVETKDADGSPMIANTVVLWASEFSDSYGHASNKLTWFLAGNANGAFKPGRTVDCGGKSVNDVHTSICNAFGVQGKFGNPAYCAGPLQALYG